MGCVPGKQKLNASQVSQNSNVRSRSGNKLTGYYGDVPRQMESSAVGASLVSIPYPEMAYSYNNNSMKIGSNIQNNYGLGYGLTYKSVVNPAAEAYGFRSSRIFQTTPNANHLRPNLSQSRMNIVSPRSNLRQSSLNIPRNLQRSNSMTVPILPQILITPPPIPQSINPISNQIKLHNQPPTSSKQINISKSSSLSSSKFSSKQNIPFHQNPSLYMHAISPPSHIYNSGMHNSINSNMFNSNMLRTATFCTNNIQSKTNIMNQSFGNNDYGLNINHA